MPCFAVFSKPCMVITVFEFIQLSIVIFFYVIWGFRPELLPAVSWSSCIENIMLFKNMQLDKILFQLPIHILIELRWNWVKHGRSSLASWDWKTYKSSFPWILYIVEIDGKKDWSIFKNFAYFNFGKVQFISKCLFGVFNFFQKTNKSKSTWGFIVVKSN